MNGPTQPWGAVKDWLDAQPQPVERRLPRHLLTLDLHKPPAPCPSLSRCTFPDCGHFLDVTSGVLGNDADQSKGGA